MPQFDVHRNPGRIRREVPFVVVVQSAWFDDTPLRLVAPLILSDVASELRPPRHMPRFVIEDCAVLLDPLQCQPVPRALLGPAVASLADDANATDIIAAIDRVISRSRS